MRIPPRSRRRCGACERHRIIARAGLAVSRAALRGARIARRLERLLCVHRLHRARRDGDRRRRLARRQPRRWAGAAGPRDPRRRPVVLAHAPAGRAERAHGAATLRHGVRRDDHAGDGAYRGWPRRARRRESGRRSLSAHRRGDARSGDAVRRCARATRRRLWRGGGAGFPDAAVVEGRRPHQHRQRDVRAARGARQRTGQAGRRHRLRSAPHHERGRPRRHRTHSTRQPGALHLSRGAAVGRQQ